MLSYVDEKGKKRGLNMATEGFDNAKK